MSSSLCLSHLYSFLYEVRSFPASSSLCFLSFSLTSLIALAHTWASCESITEYGCDVLQRETQKILPLVFSTGMFLILFQNWAPWDRHKSSTSFSGPFPFISWSRHNQNIFGISKEQKTKRFRQLNTRQANDAIVPKIRQLTENWVAWIWRWFVVFPPRSISKITFNNKTVTK